MRQILGTVVIYTLLFGCIANNKILDPPELPSQTSGLDGGQAYPGARLDTTDSGFDAFLKDEVREPEALPCTCRMNSECDDGNPCTNDLCIDSCHCEYSVIGDCKVGGPEEDESGIQPAIKKVIRYGDICDGCAVFNEPTLSTTVNEREYLTYGSIRAFDSASGRVSAAVENLDYPSGLAFDAYGNLYFGNVTYQPAIKFDIYKLAPEGVSMVLDAAVDTSKGTFAMGPWAFDLAVSPDGGVYFNVPTFLASGGGPEILSRGSIKRYDPTSGEVSTVAGNLDYPSGLAFDAYGNLYFGNVTLQPAVKIDIHKLTPGGDSVVLKNAVDTSGRFVALGAWAFDLTVSSDGGVYFVFPTLLPAQDNSETSLPGSIKRYDPTSGEVSTVVGNLDNPSGLAFDASGNLYFGNVILRPAIKFDIHKLAPDGGSPVLEPAVDTSQGFVGIGEWAFDLAIKRGL